VRAPAIDLDCQFRVSPPSIGAYEGDGPNVCNDGAGASALLAAVLPLSRSAQVGSTVTAFATIINTGTATATGCSIYPVTYLPGIFVYQTTNPATNALTGGLNTPVSITGNDALQSFVIALTDHADQHGLQFRLHQRAAGSKRGRSRHFAAVGFHNPAPPPLTTLAPATRSPSRPIPAQ
jgi:hypothetical protein